MDARDRRAARATATILVATLVCGCGTQPVPSPTPAPTASPAPTATPAPTPTPAPTYADTLRIGWSDDPGFRDLWGAHFLNQNVPANVVYGTLYKFDAQFNVVPDLADGPCVPQADPKVIRCRLIETTFQDGTPVTADDVAYSSRLCQRVGAYGLDSLKEVRVVDARTVDFVLSSVDPTFLTVGLVGIPIVPQQAVEASYADFLAATKDLAAKYLAKLADTIDKDLNRTPPVCSPHVAEAEALLAKVGHPLYREDYSRGATGQFDACAYMGTASGYIRQAADALGRTGLDAVAVALMILPIDRRPAGTGPYRFVSEDADRVHFEAWPGYHGGVAATRYLDFVPTKADGSDLIDGTVDIFQYAPSDVAFQAAAASHGVRFATILSTGGYYFLAFNVRPGRLFADVNLRKALQLCVDLPRDVEAATAGNGTPVYGPVLPGSWAFDPDSPKPDPDVAAAHNLIEGAGWRLGADGIYAKDGVRLAAPIVVRPEYPDRVKMADLIALQARDCGMDLSSRPTSFDDIINKVLRYPFYLPGTKTPFDLYIGGWGLIFDPGGLDMFTTSTIVDATHPARNNFIGFSDPLVDRLDAEGLSTYDQAERASLSRQEQEEIAAQLPYLFLWADKSYDAVRSAVTTVDGPLDLTVPFWSWQLTRMVVRVSASP